MTLVNAVQGLGVTCLNQTFQAYRTDRRFDTVLLNAVINHLDEAAVQQAHRHEWARDRFRHLLWKAHDLLKPGGTLVIADCARSNLYPLLGLKNPFAPRIEWHKHQNPGLWMALLRDVGFGTTRLTWTTPTRLRYLGRLVKSWPAAFCLYSHFVIHARR
jgi:SAM-dependent methyltransferase